MINRKIINLIVTLLILAACSRSETKNNSKMVESPSQNYFVNTTINKSQSDEIKYLCLIIHLYDKNKNEIDRYQTSASDRMKWELGWLKKDDLVVLYSSDVGVRAWEIKNNKLIAFDKITDIFFKRAVELKE